ncbi:dienelactone hydrolase family protein [Candidatus Micrarchaeota archaeon]|nr:dienelactone hydrolase family protein [Candidatus Micrarchaeota archaeon]
MKLDGLHLAVFLFCIILISGCTYTNPSPKEPLQIKENKTLPVIPKEPEKPVEDKVNVSQTIGNATTIKEEPKNVTPKIEWVTLETADGTIRALYFHPHPGKRLPAVIYNHGVFVEQYGYEQAAAQGYDVKDFVQALGDGGYAALAPIRPESNDLSSVDSAFDFLKDQKDVDGEKIIMIGFSKGGVFTLKKAIENPPGLKGIVLLAPAIAGDEIATELFSGLNNVTVPVYVGLGKNEPNKAIVENVNKLIPQLKNLGKDVRYKTDYPGDHKWFYEVRPEYWDDVRSFIAEMFNEAEQGIGNASINVSLKAQPKTAKNVPPCCNHPYYHSIWRATSQDSKNWVKENRLLIDHASVAHPAILPNGSLVVYYVNGSIDTFDCSISDDGINYRYGDCKLYDYTTEKAWDPYVIRLENGKYRLFFFGPEPGPSNTPNSKIYSALSDDGINFVQEDGIRFKENSITDPAVVYNNGIWRMYTAQGQSVIVATSSDGYTFTKIGIYNTGGSVPDVLQLEDNSLLLYICSNQGIVYMVPPEISSSVATLGVAITGEQNTIICDPGIVRLSNGTYVMYYKKQNMR